MREFFKNGSWNVICDICGFRFKAEELRKDWRGLMICSEDFEIRNPQDFIRISPEKITPPWVRPRPLDVFTNVSYACTIEGSSGIAGVGVAGCAIVGTTSTNWAPGASARAGRAVAGLAISGRF